MSTKPLVSILINNYNYKNFLNDAIDSALLQTYNHFEVIVVDDGSTDGSQDIISAYGSRIIPVFKENGGQASAFNEGFLASQGDIICFLDADDVFLPNKLEKVVSALQSGSKSVGWCFHPLKLVDSRLSGITAASENIDKHQELSKPLEFDVRHKVMRGRLGTPFVIPATSGMCFTRECLEHILPMPVEKSIVLNDSYIKFIAVGLSKGIVLEEELTLQRIHGNNLFTLNDDNKSQKADIFINTAFYMQQEFPLLGKFADNLFSTGLRLESKLTVNREKNNRLIRKYLKLKSPIERLFITLKQLFYRLKQ